MPGLGEDYVNFLETDLAHVAKADLEEGWLPIASQEDLDRAFGGYRASYDAWPWGSGPRFQGRVNKYDPGTLEIAYCGSGGGRSHHWPRAFNSLISNEAIGCQAGGIWFTRTKPAAESEGEK